MNNIFKLSEDTFSFNSNLQMILMVSSNYIRMLSDLEKAIVFFCIKLRFHNQFLNF